MSCFTFHKMEPALFLLAFALFWKSATGVQCYKCVAEALYSPDEPKCEDFDGSERFVVNCLNSTMCHKRVTTLELDNGMTPTPKSYHHRGCAAQTVHGDQRKINHKWVHVHDIHEVYEEGCKADTTDVERVTKTTHCYCYGELCNASHKTVIQYVVYIVTVCLMFSV